MRLAKARAEHAKAKAEHATAKIAVWWDMKDCPIPEGYDSALIRQSLEGAFKEKGYSGPVSITAYGDQTQTPGHILQGLHSTGISVAHTRSKSTCYLMYRDMVEWRDQNPPPATMMIISNQVGSKFSWDLVRLQQRTLYNFFLAYSVRSVFHIPLSTSETWCWKELLENKRSAPLAVVVVVVHECAKFYCKSCNCDSQRLKKFRKHLSSYYHAREEAVTTVYEEVERVTEDWGRNYKATPEFATAKIQVWWDMFDCPIPQGYDARQVRPSIEAAFKELGYTGPVSITAYGDHKHTPLQALSSTGVEVAHVVPGVEYKRMSGDMRKWHYDNPPQTAAIMMLISDSLDNISISLVKLLQENKYNFFLAYSFRPYRMSYLLTSAEWLWESMLAKHCLLSESENSESIAIFHCKLCRFDTISIDKFRAHLVSDEIHAQKEKRIPALRKYCFQNMRLSRLAEYDRHHWPDRQTARGKFYSVKELSNEHTYEESNTDGF